FIIGHIANDKHVLAVSYGIEKRKPEVIKSTNPTHRNLYSYDVADASSAAPTYFPTKEMSIGSQSEESWLVDGGIVANNPTMCAIAEAKHAWGDVSVDELRVLSIGTGYLTRKIDGPESQAWGALQWFTIGDILNLLTDERVVAYQTLAITRPGNCIRVNAELRSQPGLPDAPDDAMDDISPKNIGRLKQLGDLWFQQYGDATVKLLLDQYTGPSLDRLDPNTGRPIDYKTGRST
ncbi:MAG: patatin-like phospholipase family protein, partial [Merismopedia sp. SIO2A8]|nr:patatin-like phospholipase family protein [Merismopedia sp. SIO2A8]